jgi:uncharacterized protein (UPF0332 family)
MGLKEWEKLGWVERIPPNPKQIKNYLTKAFQDLKAAEDNVEIEGNEEWAYTMAYESMLRAGRALLLSYGLRPKVKDQHLNVSKMVEEIFGGRYKELSASFDRKKRHHFLYDAIKPITKTEANASIKNAQAFINAVITFIKSKQPQLDLL